MMHGGLPDTPPTATAQSVPPFGSVASTATFAGEVVWGAMPMPTRRSEVEEDSPILKKVSMQKRRPSKLKYPPPEENDGGPGWDYRIDYTQQSDQEELRKVKRRRVKSMTVLPLQENAKCANDGSPEMPTERGNEKVAVAALPGAAHSSESAQPRHDEGADEAYDSECIVVQPRSLGSKVSSPANAHADQTLQDAADLAESLLASLPPPDRSTSPAKESDSQVFHDSQARDNIAAVALVPVVKIGRALSYSELRAVFNVRSGNKENEPALEEGEDVIQYAGKGPRRTARAPKPKARE